MVNLRSISMKSLITIPTIYETEENVLQYLNTVRIQAYIPTRPWQNFTARKELT